MRALKVVCCAAAFVTCLTGGARADEWNKKTYLTFSGPVQIPGATLPGGTYTFEIANPDTTRHVIRVSSQDGSKTYGLFITIPNERLEPPQDNLVMFAERAAGTPRAIQVWFYPGDRIGEEFVYPRKQALELAKATHRSVLATSDETMTNTSAAKSARVERVDERGATVQAAATDRRRPATTTEGKAATTTAEGKTASTTAAAPAPGQARTTVGTAGKADTANRRARRLPRTASSLAGFELASLLALSGAVGARLLRRRLSQTR